jgi:biopolymer transport protein TolR
LPPPVVCPRFTSLFEGLHRHAIASLTREETMGDHDMRGSLSAIERSKIRRLGQVRALSPDATGELNVVPFLDVIVNVMIFVLATLAVTFTSAITTEPPTRNARRVEVTQIAPTIVVVAEGFAIKIAEGNVRTGCDGIGSGLAVPRRGNAFDYAGLSACLLKLKSSSEFFSASEQAYISANPGVDYQTIIDTTDAVRAGPRDEPLFPEINFRVPR